VPAWPVNGARRGAAGCGRWKKGGGREREEGKGREKEKRKKREKGKEKRKKEEKKEKERKKIEKGRKRVWEKFRKLIKMLGKFRGRVLRDFSDFRASARFLGRR
jgi:hypothetical protein